MITSILYLLCFVVLLFNIDKGVRYVGLFGILHVVAENYLLWWFSININLFDITLYLSITWIFDVLLIFFSSCVLSGFKKKATLFLALPIFFIQFLSLQFPMLVTPWIFEFAFKDSYLTFMEVLILTASFSDKTVKEWIKTGLVASFLLMARLIPLMTT